MELTKLKIGDTIFIQPNYNNHFYRPFFIAKVTKKYIYVWQSEWDKRNNGDTIKISRLELETTGKAESPGGNIFVVIDILPDVNVRGFPGLTI